VNIHNRYKEIIKVSDEEIATERVEPSSIPTMELVIKVLRQAKGDIKDLSKNLSRNDKKSLLDCAKQVDELSNSISRNIVASDNIRQRLQNRRGYYVFGEQILSESMEAE